MIAAEIGCTTGSRFVARCTADRKGATEAAHLRSIQDPSQAISPAGGLAVPAWRACQASTRAARLESVRVLRYVVPGVLLAALVVTGIGWYHAADAGTERAFDSCRYDGGTLVLSFLYGVNETVSPSLDTTGADVVVALRVKQGRGSAVAVGLTGEARFTIYGGHRPVRYPGGDLLTCTG